MVTTIFAGVSGAIYGCFELMLAHKRDKLPAMANKWGLLYIGFTSLLSVFTFIILSRGGKPFIIFLPDDPLNGIILAIFSGPLTSLALQRLGSKSSRTNIFTCYQDKIFTFLKDEIQHNIDLERVKLSTQVSLLVQVEDLHLHAIHFLEQSVSSKEDTQNQRKYIDDLKEENSKGLLTRYLIEMYGVPWVKKNLCIKGQTNKN